MFKLKRKTKQEKFKNYLTNKKFEKAVKFQRKHFLVYDMDDYLWFVKNDKQKLFFEMNQFIHFFNQIKDTYYIEYIDMLTFIKNEEIKTPLNISNVDYMDNVWGVYHLCIFRNDYKMLLNMISYSYYKDDNIVMDFINLNVWSILIKKKPRTIWNTVVKNKKLKNKEKILELYDLKQFNNMLNTNEPDDFEYHDYMIEIMKNSNDTLKYINYFKKSEYLDELLVLIDVVNCDTVFNYNIIREIVNCNPSSTTISIILDKTNLNISEKRELLLKSPSCSIKTDKIKV